jgi:IBR domain, a half RING-finger domain
MNCSICYKDLFPANSINLTCGCTHCDECLTTWMVFQIQQPSFHILQTVICMNNDCKRPFIPENILPQLSTIYRDEISTALTNSYITNAPDLRRCPKGGCSYAGVINIKNPCQEPLECEICGFQWRDPTSYTRIERIAAAVKHWEISSNEFLSTIWENIKTRTCEKCGVNIQKNGGCPHMTCKKCCYEFCWHCGMGWKGHDHKICGTVVVGKALVIGFPIFHILGLFGLLPYIFFALGWLLYHVFHGFIGNGTLALLNHLFTTGRRLESNRSYWAMATLFSTFVFYVYYFELGWTMLGIGIVELSGLALIYLNDKFLKRWLSNVY